MLEDFKQHINTNFHRLKDSGFLLACSGGLDSLVLVHLCHALHLNFTIAHCNFNLRGAESDADERFVVQEAKKLNKKVLVTSFDTLGYSDKNKVSVQIAARELRYSWFTEIMKEHAIPILVTAHHADDHLETFLINLSRGTGLDGLTGIPENVGVIARPLLLFSRAQILSYAHENNMAWREDKSNLETKYLRNKIRHKIVPLLKELHPTFLTNFLNTQAYLSQSAELVERHIATLRESLFVKENNTLKIKIATLQKLYPQLITIYQLFKPYGFSDAKAILALCDSLSGKELVSKTHRLLKNREYLLLKERLLETSEVYLIPKGANTIQVPIAMSIEAVTHIEDTNTAILYVDAATIKFPLVIRKWNTGDYFYPFGMSGTKKLSKFYKDEKYSCIAKEAQWLLCSKGQIVWVIGKRADNRFKVTGETKNILKFKLQNE